MGHGCGDKLLCEAQGQDDPHLCLFTIQMHRGSHQEKTGKVFEKPAETFSLLFTTEQLQAIPWMRFFFTVDESARKSVSN